MGGDGAKTVIAHVTHQLKGTVMGRESEGGAAAVEFGIVVPLLVMLLLGIMEFSRVYNAQRKDVGSGRFLYLSPFELGVFSTCYK